MVDCPGCWENAGILEMMAVARCTDAGCIRVKSWGAGKGCCLQTYTGCHNPDCLLFHYQCCGIHD
jgi:hypothetical protein